MIYLVAQYIRCSGYGYDEFVHEVAKTYTAIELDTIISDTKQLYRDGACEVFVVDGNYLADFDLSPEKEMDMTLYCYQCDKPVKYLFDDGRGKCCTRLTKDEIEGNVDEPCGYCDNSQDPNDICLTCFTNL